MLDAAYPAALLLLCLALALMIATNRAYQYTFGVLLSLLANLFRSVSVKVPIVGRIGLGAVGDAIAAVNGFILAKLGEGIDALESAVGYVWTNLIATIQELGQVLGDLAESTEKAILALQRYTVPRLIGEALHLAKKPLEGALAALRSALATAEASLLHELTRARRAADAVVGYTHKRLAAIEHSLAQTVTAGLAWPRTKIRGVERDLSKLWKRVRTVNGILTVTGILALVGAALGRLGLGWTRCSKVGRLGRAVCGMNESVIEDLIAGALVIAGTISIVELARECQAFAPDVDEGVRFFVRELG